MHVLYNCLESSCKCITLYTPKVRQAIYVTIDYLCTSYELLVGKKILQIRSGELGYKLSVLA